MHAPPPAASEVSLKSTVFPGNACFAGMRPTGIASGGIGPVKFAELHAFCMICAGRVEKRGGGEEMVASVDCAVERK